MTKMVLLRYSGRSKILKIPTEELEEHGELAYLEMKFYETFGVKACPEQNVSFHVYHSEWKENVELERTDAIEDKMKINVLVTAPKVQERKYVKILS